MEKLTKFQQFIESSCPTDWVRYSDELKDAAEVLWENRDSHVKSIVNGEQQVHLSTTYILLSALSVENLLKALMISQNSGHINTGKISKSINSHKLLVLADKIDSLELSESERAICLVAEKAIPYWGRYPIPLCSEDVYEREGHDKYRSTFLNFHFRLSQMAYDIIKDGWDSNVGYKTIIWRDARYGDVKEPILP